MIVSLWLVVGIFVGYLLVILWHAHQTEIERVQLRGLSQARLVAEHAASTFDRANIVLQGAAEDLQAADMRSGMHLPLKRRIEIQRVLARYQARVPGIVGISLAGTDGEVFSSSLDPEPGYSILNRGYFEALKQQARKEPWISEPMKGRLRGKWGIFIARRIDFSDGRFTGVIVANLGLSESFESFYRTVGIEQSGFITLRDKENKLLVRYPVIEDKINTIVAGSTFAKAVIQGDQENVVVSRSPIDDVERIVAFHRLETYPIFAAVGVSKAVALATWHQQFRIALFVIAGVVLAGAFSTYAILRRERTLRELERTRDQLDEFRQQLEASNIRLAEALTQSEKNASHDELTGLWNRRTLNQRLEETIIRSRRLGTPFCLLMFDLDHFKRINDDFGHLVGDQVLQEFSEVIQNRIRENDFLSRWGGEEFVLVLEATALPQALVLAEELREAICLHRFKVVGALTVSIGLAEYKPEDGALELLRRADQSLYFAKLEGRNRVHAGCPVRMAALPADDSAGTEVVQ